MVISEVGVASPETTKDVNYVKNIPNEKEELFSKTLALVERVVGLHGTFPVGLIRLVAKVNALEVDEKEFNRKKLLLNLLPRLIRVSLLLMRLLPVINEIDRSTDAYETADIYKYYCEAITTTVQVIYHNKVFASGIANTQQSYRYYSR
ncbi:Alanine--tRNA ligase [Basidiobolus ranarum]|uniref:Alanine--tRNA ligase n=1 Tax=Basidiobolus ranarum TaxID=34480 RepID=A0ABR2VUZ4_9FUNG